MISHDVICTASQKMANAASPSSEKKLRFRSTSRKIEGPKSQAYQGVDGTGATSFVSGPRLWVRNVSMEDTG
jgi:hypothetical protein